MAPPVAHKQQASDMKLPSIGKVAFKYERKYFVWEAVYRTKPFLQGGHLSTFLPIRLEFLFKLRLRVA